MTVTLEAILACYSPDDTVSDYQDKIRALFAQHPAPVLTLAEVWAAIDGNPEHLPTDRQEVLDTLRIIAQASDECDDKHGGNK